MQIGGGLLAASKAASAVDRLQHGDLGGAALDAGLAGAGVYAFMNNKQLSKSLNQHFKNAMRFVK